MTVPPTSATVHVPIVDAPSATVRQLSGRAPNGQQILSVVVKQTYTIFPDGRCALTEEQLPLCDAPETDPDEPELLLHDFDLYAYKPATDLVVKGHAYGRGRPSFEATVRATGCEKRVLVVGDRACGMLSSGEIVFSAPAPVDAVPLRYTHAYGGRDWAAEARYGNPTVMFGDALEADVATRVGPFSYPRNPCGRGYITERTADAVEALTLPNLEDPFDPLSPERLFAASPAYWSAMPVPQATDWVNYHWFPRIACFGVVPPHAATHPPTAEVARGLAPADVLIPHSPTAADAFRLTCGGSLGMHLPHLRGGETIELENIHPVYARFTVHLPSESPAIWTDGRGGRLNPTRPVLHSVVVNLDLAQLTLLWCGSAQALRPYLPDELATMPLRVAH